VQIGALRLTAAAVPVGNPLLHSFNEFRSWPVALQSCIVGMLSSMNSTDSPREAPRGKIGMKLERRTQFRMAASGS